MRVRACPQRSSLLMPVLLVFGLLFGGSGCGLIIDLDPPDVDIPLINHEAVHGCFQDSLTDYQTFFLQVHHNEVGGTVNGSLKINCCQTVFLYTGVVSEDNQLELNFVISEGIYNSFHATLIESGGDAVLRFEAITAARMLHAELRDLNSRDLRKMSGCPGWSVYCGWGYGACEVDCPTGMVTCE